MIIQPINSIAEICSRHEIFQAVICPGSRSAPITLAFARHPNISTFVIPDERSAGFIALGLAQSSNNPVVIICTSGTAVANLYPSIIESFYQQVPLLVFTADRPPEWIDQHDGQTIRQENIFQNHVLGSFQFPVSFDHEEAIWHSEKLISEAILKSIGVNQGPVHVNIPIREPFYPSPEEDFHFNSSIKIVKSSKVEIQPDKSWSDNLIQELSNFQKIVVLVGQTSFSKELNTYLNRLQKNLKWVIIGDITANIDGLDHPVTKHDIILKDLANIEKYKPDLLITFGKSILSKTLKNYFRNDAIKEHWNVNIDDDLVDSFKSLTREIKLDPTIFFKLIENQLNKKNENQIEFFNHWAKKELRAQSFVGDFFTAELISEFNVVHSLLTHLPKSCNLHLANSMPVRYANLIGLRKNHEISIWSNRGTSGIDGCLSTCVGHAINSKELNVLLTGDLAFFYDRNGLWHNHLPKNLRIVIINNHGGGIFRLINGPKQLDELEEFFETKQKLNAANTARDFGMKYFNAKSIKALPELFEQLFDVKAGPSILEIETDPKTNQKVFEEFNHKAGQLWK